MVEKLELALLGNPELRLAGQPLARFRSAKVYALLYYLAVTRRAQPRTALAGLFWGDVDNHYARRNLNRTLSDLTQFVSDHVVSERQSVAFDHQQPYWLDVEELEKAAATVPTAQNMAVMAAAADYYRGDFLQGFYVLDAPEFEQWVLSERTRLRVSLCGRYSIASSIRRPLRVTSIPVDHSWQHCARRRVQRNLPTLSPGLLRNRSTPLSFGCNRRGMPSYCPSANPSDKTLQRKDPKALIADTVDDKLGDLRIGVFTPQAFSIAVDLHSVFRL